MAELEHLCHHPSCKLVIPPARFACRPHWYQLPPILRSQIWREYRNGQEINKDPSEAYIAVAVEALQFWREKEQARGE